MINILKSTEIFAQDLKNISGLYWHQTATVKIEGCISEEIAIRRGVWQECVLSHLLFNLNSEAVFNEALENTTACIKINEIIINNLRYADDTGVISSSLWELQSLMDLIVEHSRHLSLHMNTSKTKFLVFSKTPWPITLRIHGETIAQVSSLKYLGSLVNQQSDPSTNANNS